MSPAGRTFAEMSGWRPAVRDVVDDQREVANELVGREPGGDRRVRREPGDELAHDCVGLVDRRKVDRLARLGERPGRCRRSDGLLGRGPDVGWRWGGPPPDQEVAAGTERQQDQGHDDEEPSLPGWFGLQRSLPLIELEVVEIGHKPSLLLHFGRSRPGLGSGFKRPRGSQRFRVQGSRFGIWLGAGDPKRKPAGNGELGTVPARLGRRG